jgi:hypothetical protein
MCVNLSGQSLALVAKWFEEGQTTGKMKCSAAKAQKRLGALRDADGAPVCDDETLPYETRLKLKRLFHWQVLRRRSVLPCLGTGRVMHSHVATEALRQLRRATVTCPCVLFYMASP